MREQDPRTPLERAIERSSIDGAELVVPPTMHSEMYRLVLEDNRILTAEVRRLNQELNELRLQRRLESVRELEAQFPRKGRRR